jgi:hypothetical protein
MDILLTASDSVLTQQKRIYRINQQYPRSVLSFVIDIDVPLTLERTRLLLNQYSSLPMGAYV